MSRLTPHIAGLSQAAGKLGEIGASMLEDRLELLALELQEVKVRSFQFLLLACAGIVGTLFGLVLFFIGIIYALPPAWRLYVIFATAALSLVIGFIAITKLRRHFLVTTIPFAQSLAELKKDAQWFSIKN